MLNTKNVFIWSLLISIHISCKQTVETTYFPFFLHEACMIVNYEQDNTTEGTYFRIHESNIADSIITVVLPPNFYITPSISSQWYIGWGTEKPLYDAGVENLREIKSIENNRIILGKLLRGNGFPKTAQRVVFWNKHPSGYTKHSIAPIISPDIWPEFAGNSIHFSSIAYDSLLQKWILIANECDTNRIQIYAAMSDNLIDWEAANNGNPILQASDFKNVWWAGRDKSNKHAQTPFTSDVVRYNNKWYLFLDGYDSLGNRHIGYAVSDQSLLDPWKIQKNPVVSPGVSGTWNEKACFYAKISPYKSGYLMVYDGQNSKSEESIGIASSEDLVTWEQSPHNPISIHTSGWRSSPKTTEPCYIKISHDTIYIILAGAKKFKMGPWHHYITRRMYLDKSGNVDDTQLGGFISTDGGITFTPHKNNPIFTNDYGNVYENEHLGANFEYIQTDSIDYIFYQAKTTYTGTHYNIMLRTKRKN
ncbi:MAG: hypothetical protein PF481_10035 [Bacteroidales bacterium]|jgi:hypothetical protein|nr:hypothetical protein [Bacteroidales bacterium]